MGKQFLAHVLGGQSQSITVAHTGSLQRFLVFLSSAEAASYANTENHGAQQADAGDQLRTGRTQLAGLQRSPNKWSLFVCFCCC